MKRYAALCILSGTLGALATTLWHQSDVPPAALAQEFLRDEVRGANRDPIRSNAQDGIQLTAEEQVNVAVYDRVNRSVVNITTHSIKPEFFFRMEVPSEGAGSGSVWDRQGHILTNYHVIAEAQRIDVTLYDSQSYEADLVGKDPDNDIAVLKIHAPPEVLFPVTPGDSSGLLVGQKVYAVGNPFGLDRTLTVGILSSLNRSLPLGNSRRIKSIIQIDAALNVGNSGGPLLNSSGQLIGMNMAIASPTGANTGVGFAIPVNTLRRVVPQLIRNGRVIRPELGIAYYFETAQGVGIAKLTLDGPAERAGLKGFRVVRTQRRRGVFLYEETRIDRSSADIIVSIDDVPVRTADDLLTVIEDKRPGDQVLLSVNRDGQTLQIPVTLGISQ